jgi:plastocyanin
MLKKLLIKEVTNISFMSFKKAITISSLLVTFLLATTLSSGHGDSSFVVLVSAQKQPQQQDITSTQKTNGVVAEGKNKVSILPQVPADKSFSPNPIKVKVGDTVTWTNNDTLAHTVTSGIGPNDPSKGKVFDSSLSALLEPGKTFSFRFERAGEFPNFCQLHPAMAGKVVLSYK